MKFERYIIKGALSAYIKYIVISESVSEQSYKVLPDTSLVLGLQYKGRLSYVNENGKEQALATAGITGLRDTYRIFKNSPGIGSLLVFFTETGAATFFKDPMHELFSESIALDNLVTRSEIDEVEEKLSLASNDDERIKVVELFLLSRLQAKMLDPMVTAAVQHIRAVKGDIRMKDLAKKLHLSQSPFEKRFRSIVGATPKKFSSIVRMRAVLHTAAQNKKLSDLGYDAGYFDQAHFIKDFKKFTGDTPEKFFSGKL